MDQRNIQVCRTKADKPRWYKETGRLHRWIFSIRKSRAGKPYRSRSYAFGQARRRSHQRGSRRSQKLSSTHVVERHRGKRIFLWNLVQVSVSTHEGREGEGCYQNWPTILLVCSLFVVPVHRIHTFMGSLLYIDILIIWYLKSIYSLLRTALIALHLVYTNIGLDNGHGLFSYSLLFRALWHSEFQTAANMNSFFPSASH